MSFTFHHLGLVHLPAARKYLSCAFDAKICKLSKMLCSLGHTVYLYGARSIEDAPLEDYIQSDNFHFIETHSVKGIAATWGDGDSNYEIGYDWKSHDYRHDFSGSRTPLTHRFYAACIDKSSKVVQPDHFLLCTQGHYHKPIADALGLYLTTEPGIGYRGPFARFRAYESDYIRNFVAGSEHPFQCINGDYYHRTIPNYFDPDDIEFSSEKENYYLFIGRQIKRKGILTADLVCRHLGAKLIIAGQGARVTSRGSLLPNDSPDFELEPGTWEYVGYCDVQRRKRLMSRAIATFTPTEYLECFAGTHVESMLSGTPVITTDFGVFRETVINGANGYRCSTLQDFVDAAVACKQLDPRIVATYGARYLMDNVKLEYQKWFEDLYQVYLSTDGKTKGWHRLRE